MALDEVLLEAMPRLRRPVLRFYSWTEPAASFGYFQRYAEVAVWTSLRPLVRRPTGGGIVSHEADWTYSLAFPAGHEWHLLRAAASYRRIHEWIQTAFAGLDVPTELASGCHTAQPGQCFAGYEKFDLLWRGKKIAGAAQRRTRNGLLIQGSVQPIAGRDSSPPAPGEDAPAARNGVRAPRQAQPLRLETNRGPTLPRSLSRADWQHAMCAVASVRGVDWVEFASDPALRDRAAELASKKYACETYTRKR
jgi:hypothetical protein